MRRAPKDARLDRHACFLIYPFRGRLPLDEAGNLATPSKWSSYLERLNLDAAIPKELDHSLAFHQFIRPALFAELTQLERLLDDESTVDTFSSDLLEVSAEGARESYRRRTSALRLTLAPTELDRYGPAGATVHRADGTTFDVDLHCQWIDVVLFPPETGFLIVKLTTEGLSVQQAGQLHRSIKKVYFRDRLRVKPANIRQSDNRKAGWAEIVPDLLDDLQIVGEDRTHTKTVGSSFRVLSASLGTDLRNDARSYGNIRGSYEGHLLALITGEELASIAHPGPDLTAALRNGGAIQYWDNWAGAILWDDVAFVADSTSFSNNYLWPIIEALYLPLYLLTLFQEIRLQEIAGDLELLGAGDRMRPAEELKELERIDQRLLNFRNRYWFSEVTRAPVLALFYERCRLYFRTDELLASIEGELSRLYSQVRTRAQDKISGLVSFVTFVGFPASLATALFADTLKGFLPSERTGSLLVIVIMAIASGIVWLLYTGRLQRPKD